MLVQQHTWSFNEICSLGSVFNRKGESVTSKHFVVTSIDLASVKSLLNALFETRASLHKSLCQGVIIV